MSRIRPPEQAHRYYMAYRSRAIAHLGGRCVRCGSEDDLEFDHVDPSKKSYSLMGRWSHGWEANLEELNKCQLLCESCHKDKHAPRHGTISMYRNRRCRCDECRKVWNQKTIEYKKAARERRSGIV